jgi:hypothetical protein
VRGFRAFEEARLAGQEAARALDLAAPLPMAREGIDAVLALVRELQQSEPRAALAACEPVLQAVTRLESSGWRAAGLRERAAELRVLEKGARARLDGRMASP